MTPNGELNGEPSPRKQKVFFVDIDNCLYSKSFKIHEIMGELIDEYFQTRLDLPKEESNYLHHHYYQEYGLAIEGLVRFHKVDPLEFNEKVDDALPLDDIIKPDPKLRKLLERIDRSKVKVWLFTNAYITHGMRVVKLLGIEDQFDGITYCDYGGPKFYCKPAIEMFDKAMREANAPDLQDCYYVDDSSINSRAGKMYGWKTAHLVEPGLAEPPPEPVADFQISSLYELPEIFPDLFKMA